MILALAGGVGGSRLVNGLARCLAPADLVVVVNTGDDFHHLGLSVSPDLDTVMYTLAGRNNAETGWGIAGDTWRFMEALGQLGGETWFRLGDADLATHVERTRRLGEGATLSQATTALCAAFGVRQRLVPMSDQRVPTIVRTVAGSIPFQHYLVRLQSTPIVKGFEYAGAANALPSPGFLDALHDDRLRAIVFAPSNPFLSIGPILAIPGIREAIAGARVPVVAVSPIIGGQAVKGPAAKIMRELGYASSAASIASLYTGLIDGIVVDERDRELRGEIETMGLQVCVSDTLMASAERQTALAGTALRFCADIAKPGKWRKSR